MCPLTGKTGISKYSSSQNKKIRIAFPIGLYKTKVWNADIIFIQSIKFHWSFNLKKKEEKTLSL